QSVSGTGADAIAEMEGQIRAHLNGEAKVATVYPHPIAFNALPEIDAFLPNGYTKEEWKVVMEDRKILGLPDLRISCTAVRIPVFVSHSEAVHVETRDPITPERARELFAAVKGVVVQDDPGAHEYPLATSAAGHDEIFVGRVRRDESIPGDRGLALWVVSDNLRKGAATNAVEIAEILLERNWVEHASARGARPYRAREQVGGSGGSGACPTPSAGRRSRPSRPRSATARDAGSTWVAPRPCPGRATPRPRWSSSVRGRDLTRHTTDVRSPAASCTGGRGGLSVFGRAGSVVGKVLGSSCWRREDVFITNIVKCRPPDNRDPEP